MIILVACNRISSFSKQIPNTLKINIWISRESILMSSPKHHIYPYIILLTEEYLFSCFCISLSKYHIPHFHLFMFISFLHPLFDASEHDSINNKSSNISKVNCIISERKNVSKVKCIFPFFSCRQVFIDCTLWAWLH